MDKKQKKSLRQILIAAALLVGLLYLVFRKGYQAKPDDLRGKKVTKV